MRISQLLLFLFIVVLPLRASDPPKLIVVLSYDQLRGDRLSFFKEDLVRDGFARVMREGHVYDSCFYSHAITLTAVGHAVLLSGTNPAKNGIVGNDFYD